MILSRVKDADPEGDVVFVENRMPDSEKPTLSWLPNELLITISRDADVIPLQKKSNNINIKIIRRKELQDHLPIGPFVIALQNMQMTWSSDDLTSKVLETCRGHKEPASRSEIGGWSKLLDDDRVIKTDTTLFPGVQVREVALLCIEELTGKSFYPPKGHDLPWREILATARDGKPERWTIVKVDPADMPFIKKSIKLWLDQHPDSLVQ